MPRVSVIIPAHNAAAFLPEALRSVREQTYQDWEVVAVDDGSDDETWSILTAPGPKLRALRNPAALGPAAARNLALAEAQGELVAFLDADDLLRPNYLERQLLRYEQARAEGRRVGLVACDALVLEDGRYAGETYLQLIRAGHAPLTLERVLRRNPIYVSALVPQKVGAAVGWFDEELFGTEDLGLWVKILERGYEAVLNPEAVAVYRRGRGARGSVSSNLARQGANACRVYELALARRGLTPRQRRVAQSALRYNRALEAVARARFGGAENRSAAQLLRLAPMLAWVVITNPGWWRQWLTILVRGYKPSKDGARNVGAQSHRGPQP